MNYVHAGLIVDGVVDVAVIGTVDGAVDGAVDVAVIGTVDGAVDGVVDGAVVGTVGGISRETNTRHYFNKMSVPIRVSVTSKTWDYIN